MYFSKYRNSYASIYFSTAVSNCSDESGFSVLKKVKSYLRLIALSIFSVEAELVEKLNFYDNINTIAHQ